MKVYEEKIVPEKVQKFHIKTVCDLCGKEATQGYWDRSTWGMDNVDIDVTIKRREGTNYPEGGSGTEYSVDMCPDCFKDKLIPWLQSQGCTAKLEEWDW